MRLPEFRLYYKSYRHQNILVLAQKQNYGSLDIKGMEAGRPRGLVLRCAMSAPRANPSTPPGRRDQRAPGD